MKRISGSRSPLSTLPPPPSRLLLPTLLACRLGYTEQSSWFIETSKRQFKACLSAPVLDAIVSTSTYPGQRVSEWVFE